MARSSHRDRILEAGLRVVRERGFSGASVRDIVQAAGVPQGSFTNHFASKEAFGLEILDIYFAGVAAIVRATLHNLALAPRDRLIAYVDAVTASACEEGPRGCLLGDFSSEVSEHSEPLRRRTAQMLAATELALTDCFAEAAADGELRRDLDPSASAALVQASLQGAILLAKAQRNSAPLDGVRTALRTTVLDALD